MSLQGGSKKDLFLAVERLQNEIDEKQNMINRLKKEIQDINKTPLGKNEKVFSDEN